MNYKISLYTIAGFIKKEFAQALRDPVLKILMFGAPIIQLTLFGYAISNEYTNIKLAVINQPNDHTARQLSDKIFASKYFDEISAEGSDYELMLRSGIADAVLIAPKEKLQVSAAAGEAKMQLLIDSQNAVKASAVMLYLRSIINSFVQESYTAYAPEPKISFDIRTLYNPEMKTSFFMVPGVMTMIICLVTIMLTGMSISKEKESGTIETIVAAPLRRIEIIIGKMAPFIILGMVDAALIISAGVIIFGVPVRGPFVLLFFSAFVFVCTTVSIGVLISTFADNQQQSMMGAFMFIFPAFLMSGIFFPIENMPASIQMLTYLDPLRYFISILRNIMLKGANPYFVWLNLAALTAICAVVVTTAVKRFHETLN